MQPEKPYLRQLVILILVLSGTVALGAWQGWRWWNGAIAPVSPITDAMAPASVKPIQVQIPSGTTTQEIGQRLQEAGVIRSSTAWKLWARWLILKDRNGSFKAGTYEISPTQPLPDIATKLWTGEVVQQSFTIPEGWSLEKMANYFESEGFFPRDEFLTIASQIPRDRYPWLPIGLPHLEGFLYPDTYHFEVDQTLTPQFVVDLMLKRFQEIALPLFNQGRNQTSLTFQEWVTLASIVEKEAVIPAERPLIAGVFTNRLQRNIPLGADPTVEYGLGIQQTPDQPLTFAQVKTPSPYNTYLNPGLPPTPIAAPGLASLKATLYPQKTDYLYFVARYDGTHVFSRTLAEHEAAQNAIHDQRASPKN